MITEPTYHVAAFARVDRHPDDDDALIIYLEMTDGDIMQIELSQSITRYSETGDDVTQHIAFDLTEELAAYLGCHLIDA